MESFDSSSLKLSGSKNTPIQDGLLFETQVKNWIKEHDKRLIEEIESKLQENILNAELNICNDEYKKGYNQSHYGVLNLLNNFK